ncbi:MAG: ATP-binding protein [Nocardioides sp.]
MDQIYTPGAGHLPPTGRLPGREHILEAWQRMLVQVTEAGRPRVRDVVLVGNRGVGKTVTMKRCVQLAEQTGYVRLAFQASRDTTMVAALLEQARHQAEHQGGAWERVVRRLSRISGGSLGIAGVSVAVDKTAQESPTPDPYNSTAIANAIGELATAIKRESGRGGVVIAVDEFQAASGEDIRALGGLLNHLNNWHAEAPVVFVATGLPSTMSAMIGPDAHNPRISNPGRLFVMEDLSQYLSSDQVAEALRGPALSVGGDWEEGAIQAVVDATAGYPAQLQVVAAAAWSHARPPLVREGDVAATLNLAQAEVDRMYNEPRWQALAPLQKAYITALSLAGGEARSGQLAAMLGRTTPQVSVMRDALIKSGDIFKSSEGWVALAQPLLATYAPLAYRATLRDEPTLPTIQDMADRRDTYRDGRTVHAEPELSDDEVRALMSPRHPGREQQRRASLPRTNQPPDGPRR